MPVGRPAGCDDAVLGDDFWGFVVETGDDQTPGVAPSDRAGSSLEGDGVGLHVGETSPLEVDGGVDDRAGVDDEWRAVPGVEIAGIELAVVIPEAASADGDDGGAGLASMTGSAAAEVASGVAEARASPSSLMEDEWASSSQNKTRCPSADQPANT